MADPRVSNPAYDDPYLAGLASNIGKMFGVGNDMGKTIVQRAQARHYQLQNDKLGEEAAGRSAVSQAFSQKLGRELTPAENDTLYSQAVRSGMKGDDFNKFLLGRNANTMQSDPIVARSMVGTGQGINKNEGVSLGDREAVASRENNEAARRSSISAGPGYAAVAESRRNHDNELAFKEKTRFDAPHNTSEGAAVNFNPEDTRFKGGPPSGSVLAPKPLTLNETTVVENADGKPVRSVIGDAIRSGSVQTTPFTSKPRHDINSPKEMQEFTWNMLSPMGVVDGTGKFDPEWYSIYGPSVGPAQDAAARAPNVGAATKIFHDTLGIPQGSSWAPGGWWRDGKLVKPVGKAPAAPVTAPANNALDQARAAIAGGAPRDKVIERLKANGINPAGL